MQILINSIHQEKTSNHFLHKENRMDRLENGLSMRFFVELEIPFVLSVTADFVFGLLPPDTRLINATTY